MNENIQKVKHLISEKYASISITMGLNNIIIIVL